MSGAIGDRLRAARRQMHLSLHDVEAKTDGEFRAASLGAYERGTREITVTRLCRLADVYGVPVESLLSDDAGQVDTVRPPKVTIDLTKLHRMRGPERDLLLRFVSNLQVRRQEFGGRSISVRSDDLTAIGCLGVTVARLSEIGLLA